MNIHSQIAKRRVSSENEYDQVGENVKNQVLIIRNSQNYE